MVRSMTGYGRAEIQTGAGPVRVEIKTNNHRYLELSPKIPPILFEYEDEARKLIQKSVRRGKVYLSLMAPDAVGTGKVVVNEHLAKEYLKAFRKVKKVLKMKDVITLQTIMRQPDVMKHTSTASEKHKVWNASRRAILKALRALDVSKKAEGQALKKDLAKRAALIAAKVRSIAKLSSALPSQHKAKMKKKLAGELKAPGGSEKFNQEMLSYSKNIDITEEIVRMESHLKAFTATLNKGGEIGRKIDFIAQEMVRETNTTGAKCGSVKISEKVIEIKSELEKIREQAQNLE